MSRPEATIINRDSNGRTYEKTDAYLNLGFPMKDGSVAKVGAVYLKLSQVNDRALIEKFDRCTEEELRTLLSRMVVSYRHPDGVAKAFDFDLTTEAKA